MVPVLAPAMAPTLSAVVRPAAGVVVLLTAAIAATALPVAPTVSDLFLGARVPAAALGDPAVSVVVGAAAMRQAGVVPSPTPAIWDDYGGGPPPTLAGAVTEVPADMLAPLEGAPPDTTDSDSGAMGGDAFPPAPTEEPIWDDYGGGSPYPPIPDGSEDDGPADSEGELQDPPVEATPAADAACADLGGACHRLTPCCDEEAGTAVCAAAAEGGEDHPTTGHCMRAVAM